MNILQEEWFRKEAGARIDALEAALHGFALYQLETLIALRRQVERIASECASLGLERLADAARKAYEAGALDARRHAEHLLNLLRAETGARKIPGGIPDEMKDPSTGLMSREAFVAMFHREIANPRARAALAAVRIANLDDVRRRHGEETARAFFGHAGRSLARLVRDGDRVARFTDNEFLIFLPGEDARGLQFALERLESAVSDHPFRLPDGLEERPILSVSGCPFGGTAAAPLTTDTIHVGVLARSHGTSQALQSVLRKEGFGVVAPADDAPERVGLFATQRVDLVVVEEAHQVLDSVLDELRSVLRGRRTPVIALVDSPVDGRRALARGAADFLVKPMQFEDLLAMIGRLTRRGLKNPVNGEVRQGGDLLLVSSDLYHLIALGTALQRELQCAVRLGRGPRDACVQVEERRPAAAILDVRLTDDDVLDLVRLLVGGKGLTSVPIVLVIDPLEQRLAGSLASAAIRAVLHRPVDLKALPQEARRAFPGLSPAAGSAASLQAEILRVVQSGGNGSGRA